MQCKLQSNTISRPALLALCCMLAVVAAAPVCAQQTRPTIAVMPLKNASGVKAGEAQIITDRLRIELFKTGNVEVMEREQMDVILKEQGFQASGACSDEACMVEMGQLLGVQYMMTGSIGKLGSLYLVNARSVNINTAKIERVISVDIKGDIEDVVEELPRIALGLTTNKEPPSSSPPLKKEEPEKEEDKSEDEDKDEKRDSTPDEAGFITRTNAALSCDNQPLLEVPSFGTVLKFTVEEGTLENICGSLQEAIAEAFRVPVRVASAEKIAALTQQCRSPVVRVRLESYSTEPSAMGQFVGTALVTIGVFDTPSATKAGFVVKIKESGDRHWGEQTPLENAFEEIGETLGGQLDKADYVKQWKKRDRRK